MFCTEMVKLLSSILSTFILPAQRRAPMGHTCLVSYKGWEDTTLLEQGSCYQCLQDHASRQQGYNTLTQVVSVMMHSRKCKQLIKTTLGDAHWYRKDKWFH